MHLIILESMKIYLLLSSLSTLPDFGHITAMVNTLEKDVTTWNYISMPFIEKSRPLNMNKTMNDTQSPTPEGGTIAYANRRNISNNASNTVSRKETTNFRCYNCHRIVHKIAECRSIKPLTDDGHSKLSRYSDTNDHHSHDTKTRRGRKISTLSQRTSDTSIATITVNSGASKHASNDK